jgi:tRNA-intron endonuclease
MQPRSSPSAPSKIGLLMSKKKIITAELIANRLIVWNSKEGSELYRLGFYGKPIGIPKPKIPEFDTPLTLDLIEGLYLLERGVIKIVEKPKSRKITARTLIKRAEKAYEDFSLKYMVYKDLREHGYVIQPGIKFGCDFAVYEHGPGIDHAPYMVQVRRGDELVTATEIVRAGRLATTVKKRFIVAVPNEKTNEVRYLMFKWWRA